MKGRNRKLFRPFYFKFIFLTTFVQRPYNDILKIMDYKKVIFYTEEEVAKQALIGILTYEDYEGFEEQEDGSLTVYIQEDLFDETLIESLGEQFDVAYNVSTEKEQNWNAVWESNFEPVVLPGFCSIRADFHAPIPDVIYDILITPKMSFGTGHHATTKLMMTLMKDIDFNQKTVFDFGCGTGILAILAEKLGATKLLGVDIDVWSYENSIENLAKNDCQCITIKEGGMEQAEGEKFDIILANINRHILLMYMEDMFAKLNDQGTLLLSGILYEQDQQMIKESAAKAGFKFELEAVENGWAAMKFNK